MSKEFLFKDFLNFGEMEVLANDWAADRERFLSDPLNNLCLFGKYKEATYREICDTDPNYARWLATTADQTPDDVREAIIDYIGDE
jgi:hypothetical protein